MVTPEMLLWLAERMGLTASSERNGPLVFVRSDVDETWSIFNPATDYAQFGRLVVWALGKGIYLSGDYGCVTANLWEQRKRDIRHNSTPDSIRAAAVVAICRALGWEGK